MAGSRTKTGALARLRAGTLVALSAALLLLLLLAGVNANAAAGVPEPSVRFAVDSEQMAIAREVARDTWGVDPCGGQVTITWLPLDGGFNALSSWMNPTTAYDNAAGNFGCHVEFSSAMRYDWPKFCTVFVHEFGHLTGHPHALDPRDVMSALYRTPIAACVNTREPGAVRAPAGDETVTRAPVASRRTPVKPKPKTKRRRLKLRAADGRRIGGVHREH